MHEFSLISTYFAPLAAGEKGALGLKDDAALLPLTHGNCYVITADAMTENVHFFAGDEPFTLARKLLRVNLSDLAAMGATPSHYLLTCVLPATTDKAWISAFTAGLAVDNALFHIHLLGGDTVSQHGPLTLSLTAIGTVPEGKVLTRSGAKAGDDIYVSGTIGDAALGLLLLKGTLNAPATKTDPLIARYHLPEPRVELGKALYPFAHSAMDISDGLLQDASHIAACSAVACILHKDSIPLSAAAHSIITAAPDYFSSIVTGGDDYELLFTAPPAHRDALAHLAQRTHTPISRIGYVTAGAGVTLLDAQGIPLTFPTQGYQHFEDD